jgi:predicted nucleotide-binding protein
VKPARQTEPAKPKKPKLFVGSASETLRLAHAVQSNLEYAAIVEVWDQAFEPSKCILSQLLDHVSNCDFGAFVFSPTDVVVLRKKKWAAVRDNVLFELGLFIGRLGIARNFIIVPRGCENLRLPTDLLGLLPLTYDPETLNENARVCLGAACNAISEVIEKQGALDRKTREIELLEEIVRIVRPAPFEKIAPIAGLDKQEIEALELGAARSGGKRRKARSRSRLAPQL